VKSEGSDPYDEPDDRVDAFVFVREVAGDRSFRGLVDLLRDRYGESPDGPIVFLAEFLGEFRASIHVAGATLGDVMDFIGKDLWEAGIHSEHAIEKKPSLSPMGPVRRSPKPPHLLLVRIELEPGSSGEDVFEVVQRIGQELELDTYASRVYGEFDVLLEVGGGAERFQDVLRFDAALERVEGIVRMTSAIAYVAP
jgi:hypothetical protein